MTAVFQTNAVLKQEVHYLENLQFWSVVTAYGIAAGAGIKLTQQHIEVLYWVRAEYDQYGTCEVTALLEKLEKDFAITNASEYLNNLFPSDPITKWFRIAGLPLSPYYQHHTSS